MKIMPVPEGRKLGSSKDKCKVNCGAVIQIT